MSNIVFEEANLNPTGEKISWTNHTAVNAVAIAAEISWQDAVRTLIEQVHIRSNMPDYHTCITDMIRASGFSKINEYLNIDELAEKAAAQGTGIRYIVKMAGAGYFALVPDESASYTLKGYSRFRSGHIPRTPDEIWEYHHGTDNRTGRSGETYKRTLPADNKKFHAENINPQDKFVGDCAVRALGAAYNGCTWDEAIDYLAQASDYTEPMINRTRNINLTLSTLGFVHHKKIYRNGKLLNGQEFCDLMSHTYFNGERIYAFVGSSHCAAILPIKQDDGTYVYKIQDTWDSTSRKITDYWTYKKEEVTPKPSVNVCSIALNEKIVHPRFGEGTIVGINGNILDVDFTKFGIKKISEEWINKNR